MSYDYLFRNDKFSNLEIKLMDSYTPRSQYRGTHGLIKHLTSVPKWMETMWSFVIMLWTVHQNQGDTYIIKITDAHQKFELIPNLGMAWVWFDS